MSYGADVDFEWSEVFVDPAWKRDALLISLSRGRPITVRGS